MSNNYVGSGAIVQNSILCDNGELFSRVNPNIGEEARIGEDDSTGENENYPDYIHKGLTLIGQNVEIPKRFIIFSPVADTVGCLVLGMPVGSLVCFRHGLLPE